MPALVRMWCTYMCQRVCDGDDFWRDALYIVARMCIVLARVCALAISCARRTAQCTCLYYPGKNFNIFMHCCAPARRTGNDPTQTGAHDSIAFWNHGRWWTVACECFAPPLSRFGVMIYRNLCHCQGGRSCRQGLSDGLDTFCVVHALPDAGSAIST